MCNITVNFTVTVQKKWLTEILTVKQRKYIRNDFLIATLRLKTLNILVKYTLKVIVKYNKINSVRLPNIEL